MRTTCATWSGFTWRLDDEEGADDEVNQDDEREDEGEEVCGLKKT